MIVLAGYLILFVAAVVFVLGLCRSAASSDTDLEREGWK